MILMVEKEDHGDAHIPG